MKRLLLALSVSLSLSACAVDASAPVPGAANETSGAAPDTDVAPRSDVACVNACLARYETCFENANSDRDICLCGNALMRCEIPCGGQGIIKTCPF